MSCQQNQRTRYIYKTPTPLKDFSIFSVGESARRVCSWLESPQKRRALAHFLPELPWALSRRRFARGKSSYPRRRSSSPWGGIQSLLVPSAQNMRYSAIPNEKSTVSQSRKSISFTPNQAQFCEMHTLTGSHPTGFRYSVDVIRSVLACSLHDRARDGAQTAPSPALP